MSLKKLVLCGLCAVLLVSVTGTPVGTPSSDLLHLYGDNILRFEDACIQQGGLCARVDECEPDNLVKIQANLCPKQQHLGVKCCYELNRDQWRVLTYKAVP